MHKCTQLSFNQHFIPLLIEIVLALKREPLGDIAAGFLQARCPASYLSSNVANTDAVTKASNVQQH